MTSAAIEYIRFSEGLQAKILDYGLDWSAVESIFLGGEFIEPASFIEGCPQTQLTYARREYRASSFTYQVLANHRFAVPSPFTGLLEECFATSTINEKVAATEMFTPLIYCLGSGSSQFILATASTTGRFILLFMPSKNICVYELDDLRARRIVESLDLLHEDVRVASDIIVLVEMTDNFGHQLINHLSGLEIISRNHFLETFSELWISGPNYFGDIVNIFPELAKKAKFLTRHEIISRLKGQQLVVRAGSNRFFSTTKKRIHSALQARAHWKLPDYRFPKIAITTRESGRRCRNLAEVVAAIYNRFRPIYPDVCFIIDGWVFKEAETVLRSSAATCFSSPLRDRLARNFDDAASVFRQIPIDSIIANTIGCSIFDSIGVVSQADLYLAHVGTLQHKIGFFSASRGLVHGPRHQLQNIEAGAFLAEEGMTPVFLEPEAVIDDNNSERKPSEYDYTIVNVSNVVDELLKLVPSLR